MRIHSVSRKEAPATPRGAGTRKQPSAAKKADAPQDARPTHSVYNDDHFSSTLRFVKLWSPAW